MEGSTVEQRSPGPGLSDESAKPDRSKTLRWAVLGLIIALAAAVGFGLTSTANSVKRELQAAVELLPQLEKSVAAGESSAAISTVAALKEHTAKARADTGSPLWTLAALLPWIGPNLQAVTDVAVSADDIARLGAEPLVSTFQSLDWKSLVPDQDGVDLAKLQAANPKLQAAAHAVTSSSERLNGIETSALLPQVVEPLVEAQTRLGELSESLEAATRAANIAPVMLGADSPRTYLLMVQNNAEPRATGGIPGALITLHLDKGLLTLGTQSSASAIGTVSPPVQVDEIQKQIYSGRLGKFMQDVNLTPDFPSAASTAQLIWEKHTGQKTDGIISVDPVALSYLLEATGGVSLAAPEGVQLPSELTSHNVVTTLLSKVYTEIPAPDAQDVYFAMVAKQIFDALGNGRSDPRLLVDAISKGAEEGRVLLWSSRPEEQRIIETHRVGGAITGLSVQPAQFGIYLNDGTGAKMDYYVKRTVKLIKQCPRDGYSETVVQVTSTNTASESLADSLPTYVTGGGNFGVPSGSVQTNVAVYGPVQAQIESAKLNGARTEFAPYLHDNRPLGILAVRLAPGESKTVEFTFGKIVQHAEPSVVVTPTVQPVKDVTMATENASCS
ncbi:DUF4012 domain-containing protein [Pseudarthrobacter sp. NamE5]|uniref:DUF4012 domain-containing protein n=1 Tax=Pseudarthrobacter sp. NamE5 TaxID=2576839 RepID=UPI00110A58AA|nr:DUF4012 domain-containing protein [Pseudarthrobacter sp. NamE5]TLM81681.1 DUF4012 domain-containing protein [Pseudarthrobacter sp. NamE5]